MNQTKKSRATLAAASLAALLLGGCASSTTPNLDARFGEAATAVRAQQTLNPAAPSGQDNALGLGGKPAVHAQERYHDSFKTPPRTFEILGIGGSLGGQ